MVQQIEHLTSSDIANAFSEWQTKDMHRKRAFTKKIQPRGSVRTVIRQHSLYEMQRSERVARRYARAQTRYEKWLISGKKRRRKPRYVMYVERYQERTSNRPILRPVMEDKLLERMTETLNDKIAWWHSRMAARAAL